MSSRGRGRPASNTATDFVEMNVFRLKTQYQTTLMLCFLIYQKLVTEKTSLTVQIRESGFEFLSFLPKTYYENNAEFSQDMEHHNFKNVPKNAAIFSFLTSIWGTAHRVIIRQVALICQDYLLCKNNLKTPILSLTQVRRHYQSLSEKQLDRTFKYIRFNVGIIDSHVHTIRENLRSVWKSFIFIITKLVYLVDSEKEIGYLAHLYKFSEDDSQRSFLQIGTEEQRKYALDFQDLLVFAREYNEQVSSRLMPHPIPLIPYKSIAIPLGISSISPLKHKSFNPIAEYPELSKNQTERQSQSERVQLIEPENSQKLDKESRLEQIRKMLKDEPIMKIKDKSNRPTGEDSDEEEDQDQDEEKHKRHLVMEKTKQIKKELKRSTK